jgi:hypothetical protein
MRISLLDGALGIGDSPAPRSGMQLRIPYAVLRRVR